MPERNLILEQIELGPMLNFVYMIGDPATKKVAVVDPAWDVQQIINVAKEKDYSIEAILLTHGHYDHVDGVSQLKEQYDVEVYLSKQEADFHIPQCSKLVMTEDHQIIKIGNIEIECIQTPGHTPGCQCYRSKGVLLTGDTLFVDGCGRCDFPGGDVHAMYDSLYNVVKKLPDELIVYPGHLYGPVPYAVLGDLKKNNPFLNCQSREEFLSDRMGMVA